MTPAPPYFTTGKISSVVTHGLTWLPDSQLSVAPLPNVDAAGAAQFRGGVVANSLLLVPQNLAGGLTPIIAGTSSIVAAPRTMTITSVATPTGGTAATTIKVVATYPTTANGYPTIVSWRKL
jgi:hypothetical protein